MRSVFIVLLLINAGLAFSQDSLHTISLDEVVVTGQYEPQSLRQSVYQVRTISNNIIQMRNATNVQGVLNTELGIRFSNDLTLGTSGISVMGMSGQNVKILLDGVPMLDRGETRESLNQIDMNIVERIEIVEGPMSVMYGSDALAGVINIITKKGQKTSRSVSISSRIQEETAGDEYEAFSGEGQHNENVTVNWQGKYLYANGSITRNNFGGLQGSREGREKEWLPKDQWLGMGTIGYAKDNLNVWYRINYMNEILNSPGAPNPSTNKAIDKEYITNRITHQAQTELDISNEWSFSASASYQDYSRRTRTTEYNVATGSRFLSPTGSQDESVYNATTFRGTFIYKPSDRVSWQYGIDMNYMQGMGDRIDQKRAIGDYALFVSTEIKPLSFLDVRPGLRFMYNSAYDAPPAVPSLNMKAKLSGKFDLRAAYARGFRAPTLSELYFYFFDASHQIQGNPDLKAEYSNSFNLSLAWYVLAKENTNFNITGGAFYNEFKDRIILATDPSSNESTYLNLLRYKTTGLTLNNTLAYKNFTATLGAAHIGVYNEYSEDDATLPKMMWTPELNAFTSYQVEKTNTTLSFFYKYTGKRASYQPGNTGEVQLAEQESFHWLDFNVTQRITKFLQITAGVKNLLDVTRLQNTSQDTGGAHSTSGAVPMSYGRSFVVGINFAMQ